MHRPNVAIGLAASALLAGMSLAPIPALRPEPPRLPAPSYISGERGRAKRRRQRRETQAHNRARNLRRRRRNLANPLVKGMTNWQRTQWARAGYPQDRKQEFATLVRFTFGRSVFATGGDEC